MVTVLTGEDGYLNLSSIKMLSGFVSEIHTHTEEYYGAVIS